ncbi:hypothetical protein CYMTET_34430 [Cymbomonas tetramitiformis]|uniref:PHD-type domain-containing protein n=1 Tax=Cymbomonas tetramitiformis TaxID=36881 RepID=A0AAE0FB92_9CHLO|nr:hypothetical protein CYMTET_34430 [Cymbomonas tetramitiformis]
MDSYCALCRTPGDTLTKAEGLSVHHNCAIWSPNCYENELGALCNVRKEVQRGERLRCTAEGCNKAGATLGCSWSKKCKANFHYPCAVSSGCLFDKTGYVLYCPKHSHRALKEALVQAPPAPAPVPEIAPAQAPSTATKSAHESFFMQQLKRWKQVNATGPQEAPIGGSSSEYTAVSCSNGVFTAPESREVDITPSEHDGAYGHTLKENIRPIDSSSHMLIISDPKLPEAADPKGDIVCGLCRTGGGEVTTIDGCRVHDMCALWAPNCFQNEAGEMQNVRKEVRRGKKMKCSGDDCGQPGATIGCRIPSCPVNFHYPCALRAGCYLDEAKFLLSCPKHLPKRVRKARDVPSAAGCAEPAMKASAGDGRVEPLHASATWSADCPSAQVGAEWHQEAPRQQYQGQQQQQAPYQQQQQQCQLQHPNQYHEPEFDAYQYQQEALLRQQQHQQFNLQQPPNHHQQLQPHLQPSLRPQQLDQHPHPQPQLQPHLPFLQLQPQWDQSQPLPAQQQLHFLQQQPTNPLQGPHLRQMPPEAPMPNRHAGMSLAPDSVCPPAPHPAQPGTHRINLMNNNLTTGDLPETPHMPNSRSVVGSACMPWIMTGIPQAVKGGSADEPAEDSPTCVLQREISPASSQQVATPAARDAPFAGMAAAPVPMPSLEETPPAGGTGSAMETCALCGMPGSGLLHVEGQAIHETCGLWAPNCYEDPPGSLCNVAKEVRRGAKLRCTWGQCAQPGATIGCMKASCKANFHLPCAISQGCQLDHERFVLYCPKHTPKRKAQQPAAEDEDEGRASKVKHPAPEDEVWASKVKQPALAEGTDAVGGYEGKQPPSGREEDKGVHKVRQPTSEEGTARNAQKPALVEEACKEKKKKKKKHKVKEDASAYSLQAPSAVDQESGGYAAAPGKRRARALAGGRGPGNLNGGELKRCRTGEEAADDGAAHELTQAEEGEQVAGASAQKVRGELKGLAMWGWDARLEEHPPGTALSGFATLAQRRRQAQAAQRQGARSDRGEGDAGDDEAEEASDRDSMDSHGSESEESGDEEDAEEEMRDAAVPGDSEVNRKRGELKGLAMWGWDARLEEHPPGAASLTVPDQALGETPEEGKIARRSRRTAQAVERLGKCEEARGDGEQDRDEEDESKDGVKATAGAAGRKRGELKGLAMWGWDARLEEHPPGAASLTVPDQAEDEEESMIRRPRRKPKNASEPPPPAEASQALAMPAPMEGLSSYEDDGEEDVRCETCQGQHNQESMVLCNQCISGYHIECLRANRTALQGRALPTGSEEEWFCNACANERLLRVPPLASRPLPSSWGAESQRSSEGG